MAVNCSEILLKSSWMAVELPMKVEAILRPRGGMSHTAVLMLLGIHSTKYEEFLFCKIKAYEGRINSIRILDSKPGC